MEWATNWRGPDQKLRAEETCRNNVIVGRRENGWEEAEEDAGTSWADGQEVPRRAKSQRYCTRVSGEEENDQFSKGTNKMMSLFVDESSVWTPN
jgi:hypothetical protein